MALSCRELVQELARTELAGELPQQRETNIRSSIVAYVFRGFCVSAAPAGGKHATVLISYAGLLSC
jgi:hypothetical protein